VDERDLVPAHRVHEFFHPNNWTMFSPTDLRKLYLKEAFADAGVAASDERVRTWVDERRRLGRDVLRILRSELGGRYTLDDSAATLKDASSSGLVALYGDFATCFRRELARQYGAAVSALQATLIPPTRSCSVPCGERCPTARLCSSSFSSSRNYTRLLGITFDGLPTRHRGSSTRRLIAGSQPTQDLSTNSLSTRVHEFVPGFRRSAGAY
jgi:hypothetical protein